MFRRVARKALESLQDILYENVLVGNHFTTLGAAQFLRDVHAIFAVIDRYIPDGSAALAFLVEAVQLLNLRAEDAASEKGQGAVAMTLKQASDRVFVDNNEARRVLEELGIEMLDPGHARRVLQNRVENSA